ncbi:MAG: ThiF family adenylyltransferase [Bdellovibrionales bacterium]|nr:ThiF family adenylyltransferase [Bdellovibrionales bacterium]
MFAPFDLASSTYQSFFDGKNYQQRTKRNQFWLGGSEGQMRLHNLKVGIAGLGGMGSHIAELLVRLGVGYIKIADPDTIETSNINRQVIANQKTIHMLKTDAMTERLREIAQDFELIVYKDGIHSQNAEEFVNGLDVVVDEIDVYPLKAHCYLHEAARKKNIPIYSSFVIGVGCHIYKFASENYTFEDFLSSNELELDNPKAQLLVDKFCYPLPSYLQDKNQLNLFTNEVSLAAPILGTSTLLGQSILIIRMLADQLNLEAFKGIPQTPIMPEFIKIDPLDLHIKVCKIKNPIKS